MHKINLIVLGDIESLSPWHRGEVFVVEGSPKSISRVLAEKIGAFPADAWLVWDPALGEPPGALAASLLDGPGDAWHAGLKLGLDGQPALLDFIHPTWMLNRDPDPGLEATSWRVSLRACLVRTDVLRQLGLPDPGYQTLAGASLDWGYRLIRGGAFVRHVPELASMQQAQLVDLPLADQWRFARSHFVKRWQVWAGFRSVLSGYASPGETRQALRETRQWNPVKKQPVIYQRKFRIVAGKPVQGAVSVLIPTVRRYTYLRTLLGQLRAQTVPPLEIIVVDQTPQAERDPRLEADFADLPLRYLTLDKAGQCASRNLGLRKAQGAYILFIDDDDEVPPDLIEKHLAALHTLGVQVSNGVAHEVGTGELPADFRMMRISNVFPTNNTMIRKDVLNQSGLFDLAYDHGQRADHDLGMRIYLSGEIMVLDPSIDVVHHHAPLGGLREHRARVSTYAAARTGLFKFDLPSVSDLYLAKRYFSKRQVREMLWISLLGTFSLRGSKGMRLLKGLIAFVWLPYHLGVLHKRRRRAEQLLQDYPQIPNLKEEALL